MRDVGITHFATRRSCAPLTTTLDNASTYAGRRKWEWKGKTEFSFFLLLYQRFNVGLWFHVCGRTMQVSQRRAARHVKKQSCRKNTKSHVCSTARHRLQNQRVRKLE